MVNGHQEGHFAWSFAIWTEPPILFYDFSCWVIAEAVWSMIFIGIKFDSFCPNSDLFWFTVETWYFIVFEWARCVVCTSHPTYKYSVVFNVFILFWNRSFTPVLSWLYQFGLTHALWLGCNGCVKVHNNMARVLLNIAILF